MEIKSSTIPSRNFFCKKNWKTFSKIINIIRNKYSKQNKKEEEVFYLKRFLQINKTMNLRFDNY